MSQTPVSATLLKSKWRPALWMVVFGVLMLVALLPLAGLLLLIGMENVTGITFKLRTFGGLLTLALGSMAMAAMIGAVFLRTLLRPLQELITRTVEIEAGAPDAFRNIDYGGTQEVAALGERFFRLARRLSDRSNYLTLFTTHVSHELKTPLTSIQGAAELLRDGGDSMKGAQRQRFLGNIVDDTARLAALSTRLRELAHADVADTGGQSQLQEVAMNCVKQASLKLEIQGNGERIIAMSPANAEIVWQQLSENAAQQGASILCVRIGEATESGLLVCIGDDGAAISKSNREHLFDPFFTTRREQGGTGMGLGIAQAMLRSHGGSISLSQDEDYKFEIRWPL